ncbi:MAG: TlpA family protein disulfide reductase [Acidobacteria bacterium]|nr:TlpA family protein disulfide reductase [Acidobacteriota bacterium]
MLAILGLGLVLALGPQEASRPTPKAKTAKRASAPQEKGPVPVALSPAAQAVLDGVEAKGKAIREALKAHTESGKAPKDFKAEVGAELAEIAERLKGENPVEVREALLLARYGYQRLAFQRPSPEQLDELRAGIHPTSPVWMANPGALAAVMDLEKPAQKAYLLEAMEKNPAPEVRRAALFAWFLDRLEWGEEAAWKPALAKLEKEHAGSREAQNARRWVDSAARTAPGKPAPPFAIPALGDPSTSYTPAAFKGKVLLVDFWATWCPPCRAELPAVHKAYARFKDRGFEILSLSFDRKAEDIAPFRAKPETPMPWKHAFVEGGFQSELAKAYGVMGIPKPVLLGPDGRILAVESDLRGEKLEKTLEKFLGN